MKKSIVSVLVAALFVIAAYSTAHAQCGPTFIAHNDKGLPVKSIELKNFYTGYSTTVYDPVFPYDFGEREAGVYVFTVTYDAPLEGSIGIKPDVGQIWCSGPKWESTWSMSWPSHICTPNHIKIVPDISCRE
jgi:hypothetical protein